MKGQEEEQRNCCSELGVYFEAFGESITIKLRRIMVAIQLVFVAVMLLILLVLITVIVLTTLNRMGDYSKTRLPVEFDNLGREVNVLIQSRLARYAQIVTGMADTYHPSFLTSFCFVNNPAPHYYSGSTAINWAQSQIYCPYNPTCFFPPGSTFDTIIRLGYYDYSMPYIVPPDLRPSVKRVSIMFAKNGTANNVASNFVKFWPSGPYTGKPAEIVSTANYNFFTLARGLTGGPVLISQPYLDFKDGSNEIIFSLSRTVDLSSTISNAMLFFIVQVRCSTFADLLNIPGGFPDMQIAVVSNQGFFYHAPSYWGITSANFISSHIYDLKNYSGFTQQLFVVMQNKAQDTISKMNESGLSPSYVVTASLIPQFYSPGIAAQSGTLVSGEGKVSGLGMLVLVYVPDEVLNGPVKKSTTTFVNDLTGLLLTMIAYSILIINEMAGFTFLVRSMMVSRLDTIAAHSDRIYELSPNELPEVKEEVRSAIHASVSELPYEYNELFKEFSGMCDYIIDAKTEFVYQDRVCAFAPNNFSKELLSTGATDVNLTAPAALQD